MIELDYGNARLRARRSRLFDVRAYQELMSGSVDDLLAALSRTPYRADVEAALSRAAGLRALHEALRTHLARTLREVQSFYTGDARRGLLLLLRRYDVDNLVTILRGRARRADPAEVMELVVVAGTIDETTLRELARRQGLREMIDRMLLWRVPSSRIAGRLLEAFLRYQHDGDLAALEQVLLASYAEEMDAELHEKPVDAELDALLRNRIDRLNLLTTVRLWETTAAAARRDLDKHLLPGGRVPWRTFMAAFAQDSREELARPLPAWRDALARWSETGDRLELSADLERAELRAAMRLFVHGDPLGIAIPVAFIVAKENEVRNLRAIGHGLSAGLAIEEIRDLVVTP